MEDFANALITLSKYKHDKQHPSHCEHDMITLYVDDIDDVSYDDVQYLNKLGFWKNKDLGGFSSYRFGSC